jgi:hypothetical protein
MKANFEAHYSDETDAMHCLTLDMYGDTGLRENGHWILIEPLV